MQREKEDNCSGNQYIKTKAKNALVLGVISLGFCILKGGVRYLWKRLSDDYYFKWKAEDHRRKREEEQAYEEQHNHASSEANEMPDPRPANDVVNGVPEDIEATRLYADFIYKGNIVVVFGPKGQGKSVFSTQLLAEIATGSSKQLFPEYGKQHEGQHGIILDFEQSPTQLKSRYGKEGYSLPEHLELVLAEPFSTLEAFKDSLKKLVDKLTTDTVIDIDNVSKALPTLYDESARELNAFLKSMINYAKREKAIDLTIILVSHPNKEGYGGSIGTEHLKGTSKLADLADVLLVVGPTRFGRDTKMLKVLNNRNWKEPETVLVMKMVDSKPYLHFERVREMHEEDALPRRTKNPKWTNRHEANREVCGEQSEPESMFTHEDKVEIWRLNKKEKLSGAKIAEIFKQRGKEATRQTIYNYINEIEAEKQEEAQDPDQQQ